MRIISAITMLFTIALAETAQAQSEQPAIDARAAAADTYSQQPGYHSMAVAWNAKGQFTVIAGDSIEQAKAQALSACNKQNGNCTPASAISGSSFACLAIARNLQKATSLSFASRSSMQEARSGALDACAKNNGSSCKVEYSVCNTPESTAARTSSPATPMGANIPKVFAYPQYDNVVGITIFGPIVPGDDALFKAQVLSSLHAGKVIGVVRIYSPGGSVNAATKIGEQIRLLQAETETPILDGTKRICRLDTRRSNAGDDIGGTLGIMRYDTATREGDHRCECESACSLIWAAGVGRNGGLVGVHRFSIGGYGNLTMTKAKEVYERELVLFRGYLVSMGAPQPVIDALLLTSSQGMRYLSRSEISQMNNFPVYLAELVLAKCGRKPDPHDLEPIREKYRSCAIELYKEKYRDGAKAYLQKYGRG